MLDHPLVSGEELAARLGDERLAVIDFRSSMSGRDPREACAAGHIPGAAFVDLDRQVTGPGPGRHPLPFAVQLEAAMQQAGVRNDADVVVYDDAGGSIAARLWWMLRAYGHYSVAVLDGGLQAFPGPLEQGEPAGREPTGFLLREPDSTLSVGFAQVLERSPGTVLLDARSTERFNGEPSPLDPRPGHIPGARSAPWAGNLGPDGRLLPPESLAERYRELGVERGDEVIAYCGSGVTACHDLLALELAGLPGGRLYVGSWSDWASRPDAPAELG